MPEKTPGCKKRGWTSPSRVSATRHVGTGRSSGAHLAGKHARRHPGIASQLQQSKNALSTLLGQPPGGMEALLRGPERISSASNVWPLAYPRIVAPTARYPRRGTLCRRRERGNRRRRRNPIRILPPGRRRRAEQRRRQALRTEQPVLHRRTRVPMVHLELRTHHQQCAGRGRALPRGA